MRSRSGGSVGTNTGVPGRTAGVGLVTPLFYLKTRSRNARACTGTTLVRKVSSAVLRLSLILDGHITTVQSSGLRGSNSIPFGTLLPLASSGRAAISAQSRNCWGTRMCGRPSFTPIYFSAMAWLSTVHWMRELDKVSFELCSGAKRVSSYNPPAFHHIQPQAPASSAPRR